MSKMRTALLIATALFAFGCAKEQPVAAKPLKDPKEVTGVVKEGMTMDEVKQACGAPGGEFATGAPNADTFWTYDIPAEKPETRVQIFFLKGKVVSTAEIPFQQTPTEPSRG